MRIYDQPPPSTWEALTRRPSQSIDQLRDGVQEIMDTVKEMGDQALIDYTSRFDGVGLRSVAVGREEIAAAAERVPEELKEAIRTAHRNVEAFHRSQRTEKREVETMPGVTCWREARPIERVGLYVPGGTAPLFSTVIMLAVPARLAGCEEIVLCSPPGRDTGEIHPAVLFTADLCGVTKIFRVGGAQAIAAMLYGTDSVPSVYKLFGPGNAYVTVAKQLAQLAGVAIDMPAGPSEVLVCADTGAKPLHVAMDLLAQAEHGPDSQVILVTDNAQTAHAVKREVEARLTELPRREAAARSIENSHAVILSDYAERLAFVNAYAPEHLILSLEDARSFAAGVVNAGSIFLGYHTPESVGDYASGTNHTLPTHGYARNYSGVSLDSFVKQITFQELTPEGLRGLGPAVETMAAAESLEAHKLAVSVRLADLD